MENPLPKPGQQSRRPAVLERRVVAATALDQKLPPAEQLSPQPELHLPAKRSTPYEKVAEVMSAAAREGLARIGFVTQPSPSASQ